jgi:U3 small nucleolar RNA-associated protein 14
MDNGGNKTKDAHDEVEEDDDGRHVKMLEGITGMPSQAFEGKMVLKDVLISKV